jgi:hypothetical protein
MYGDVTAPRLVVVQRTDAEPVSVMTNHHRRRYVVSGGDPAESIQVNLGTPVSLVSVRSRHLYLTDSRGFTVEDSRFGGMFVDRDSNDWFLSGEAEEIRTRSDSTLSLEDISAREIHVRDNAALFAVDVDTNLLAATSTGKINFSGDAFKTSANNSADILMWGNPGAQFINGEQRTERVRPSIKLD